MRVGKRKEKGARERAGKEKQPEKVQKRKGAIVRNRKGKAKRKFIICSF